VTRRAVLTLTGLLIFVIGLLPVLSMLVQSLHSDGHWSLGAYRGLLASARQWTLMEHSLVLAALVTALTLLLGVPLGLLLGKTDLPGRRLLTGLFVVPLLLPPYVLAVSWADLLGPEGLLARIAGPDAVQAPTHWLFGLPGCVLVLGSVFLPIPMLLTMVFLRTVDPRLEEAARLMAPWPQVLRGITLPLILPGIALAAVLVFLLSLGEFSVPTFLRYDVFPVESFVQFSAFYDFQAATAAAVPLAGITLILLLLEGAFLRERTGQLRLTGPGRGWPRIALGARRTGWVAVAGFLASVLVLVPMGALAVQSADAGAYEEALHRAGDSLVRSLVYASIGATTLTVLGFLAGYLVHTRALPFWRSVDSVTLFLFALPSTVIGIGLISLWNTPWTNLVYATPAIIVLGYLAKYTVLTSRISATQLGLIPPSMEEAAQVAGAGWTRRMAWIVAPLAGRGLAAAWLVGYLFSLRDTGITMLVYPPGHETLPVRIFTLMANGSPQLIAALCLIMVAASVVPLGLLALVPRLGRRLQRI